MVLHCVFVLILTRRIKRDLPIALPAGAYMASATSAIKTCLPPSGAPLKHT